LGIRSLHLRFAQEKMNYFIIFVRGQRGLEVLKIPRCDKTGRFAAPSGSIGPSESAGSSESYGQMTEGWDPIFRVLPKSKHEVPHSFTLLEGGRLALREPRKSTIEFLLGLGG